MAKPTAECYMLNSFTPEIMIETVIRFETCQTLLLESNRKQMAQPKLPDLMILFS